MAANDDDNDDDTVQIEGVMHDNTLYLVNHDSGNVYRERLYDSDGEPTMIVGKWRDDGIDFTATANDQISPPIYTYDVDDDDHCETPLIAYQHIQPTLSKLRELMGISSADSFRIYDPYYCQGSVQQHLRTCGFTNVYNRNEDFYHMQSHDRIPPHDIVITNPPYSGDHIEKCLRFCVSNGKPWLILVPNYVYAKDYYNSVVMMNRRRHRHNSTSSSAPVYIVPKGIRYQYKTPTNQHTSPFITFWYANFGAYRQQMLEWWRQRQQHDDNGVIIAKSVWKLPKKVLHDRDKRKKRKRKNQRDAAKRRKQAQS